MHIFVIMIQVLIIIISTYRIGYINGLEENIQYTSIQKAIELCSANTGLDKVNHTHAYCKNNADFFIGESSVKSNS